MDHIIPFLALVIEFSLNMQPIIRRHLIAMCFIILAWVLVTICTCIMGNPPYPWLIRLYTGFPHTNHGDSFLYNNVCSHRVYLEIEVEVSQWREK